MAIDEAFQRIVRQHWLLVIGPAIVFSLLGAAQAVDRPPQYAATSRVQVGTSLASSQVQADAASARALGLATSPGVVQRALTSAQVAADPTTFAAQNISVGRVGVSPIVTLTVTWKNRKQATDLAESITDQVLAFSNESGYHAETQRIQDLDTSIASLQKSRDDLVPRLQNPQKAIVVQAQIGAIDTTLQDDLRQRSDLIVAAASRSSSVLIDAAHTVPVSAGAIKSAALGLLAGLAIGLGLAALLETIRPRLKGAGLIARTLQTTVLGHLDGQRQRVPWHEAMRPIIERVQLLGRACGATHLLLLPVDLDDEIGAGLVAEALGKVEPDGSGSVLSCCLPGEEWDLPGRTLAVVIFSPVVVTPSQLEVTRTLVATLGRPVIGVVTYVGDVAGWATAAPSVDADRPQPPLGVR